MPISFVLFFEQLWFLSINMLVKIPRLFFSHTVIKFKNYCCKISNLCCFSVTAGDHHVYMDNYYTAPAHFTGFRELGFGACGTVLVNRR